MFNFFSKIRQEVAQSLDNIHTRLTTLEARVGALFNHVNTTTTSMTSVVQEEVKAAEAATVEAVAAKIEEETKAP